jgi:hypothetical protein
MALDKSSVAVPLIGAALLAWQLLIPPVTGLANNSDFAKVAGLFSLLPERTGDDFVHIVTKWKVEPGAFWDSGFRTTEHLHAGVMALLGGDLRWQGVTHGAVMVAALAILASVVQWRALLAIPLLLDLAYSAYFNSMYMDAAAIVWLSLSIAAMARGRWWLACVAAILFFGAKSAHALPGVALVAAAASRRKWLIAILEGAAMIWSLSRIAPEYRAQAMYNVIFTKVAAHTSEAEFQRIAMGLGIREDELRWRGSTAFEPQVPAQNREWLLEFSRRVPLGSLVKLYAREPWLAWRFMWSDLNVEAPRIRPVHLGNFDRSAGRAAGEPAGGPLSWWSSFRSRLIETAPWHLPLMFAAAGLWIALRPAWTSIEALLWAMALMEFVLSTLADACETSRHLVLFHFSTDALVFTALLNFRPFRAPSSSYPRPGAQPADTSPPASR